MFELGKGPRLALKAAPALRISGEIGRKDLQRDVAAEACVTRTPDLAHATGADARSDLVRAEPRSRRDDHGAAIIARCLCSCRTEACGRARRRPGSAGHDTR